MKNEFLPMGMGEAVVVAELGFKVCKVTIKKVGGIGDLQGWITQTGEQPWQIAFEAKKGTAKTGMSVTSAFCVWSESAFIEEVMPAILPSLEGKGEIDFFHARKGVGQMPELSGCRKFWVSCEVAPDDGNLMELAHLNGDVSEG